MNGEDQGCQFVLMDKLQMEVVTSHQFTVVTILYVVLASSVLELIDLNTTLWYSKHD